MMTRSFLVNPDDGTINIHYDGLNPSEVRDLIGSLENNLRLLTATVRDPIQIMKQSVRRNRLTNEISFRLSWNRDLLRVNLDDPEVPKPNVELTSEQIVEYLTLIDQMIGTD